MDWQKLQRTLFAIEPSDRAADMAKLAGQSNSAATAPPTKNYVTESAAVTEGSLGLDGDYSIADFAALAGVTLTESQKNGDYAKGSDSKPDAKKGRTSHPLKDKLVGENFKDAFTAGKDNFNKLDVLKKGNDAYNSAEPVDVLAPKGTPRRNEANGLNPALAAKLAQYETQLMQIMKNPRKVAKLELFLQKYAPGQSAATPSPQQESIKEQLYRKLNNK